MLEGAVKETLSYNANTFMIYTGAPQNTRRKPIEEMKIPEGKALMQANGIDEFIVHAPYIINLGNTIKLENFGFAIEFLRAEIERAQALGAKQITLHPGAHVGAGVDAGLAKIIEGLNEVLTRDQTAQIALETMAGKGTELGRTFDELARIIDGVTLNEKLSVTFDTCHTHDAGYNIKEDFDGVSGVVPGTSGVVGTTGVSGVLGVLGCSGVTGLSGVEDVLAEYLTVLTMSVDSGFTDCAAIEG